MLPITFKVIGITVPDASLENIVITFPDVSIVTPSPSTPLPTVIPLLVYTLPPM